MDQVRLLPTQWHCDHAPVDRPASSSSNPIRWRPRADPVQKQDPGERTTKKGLTNPGPLQKRGYPCWYRYLATAESQITTITWLSNSMPAGAPRLFFPSGHRQLIIRALRQRREVPTFRRSKIPAASLSRYPFYFLFLAFFLAVFLPAFEDFLEVFGAFFGARRVFKANGCGGPTSPGSAGGVLGSPGRLGSIS
jgi:hypothetical protein